jgi:hypothetical protein
MPGLDSVSEISLQMKIMKMDNIQKIDYCTFHGTFLSCGWISIRTLNIFEEAIVYQAV